VRCRAGIGGRSGGIARSWTKARFQTRKKKARRPFGCGLNPIQEELEETGPL